MTMYRSKTATLAGVEPAGSDVDVLGLDLQLPASALACPGGGSPKQFGANPLSPAVRSHPNVPQRRKICSILKHDYVWGSVCDRSCADEFIAQRLLRGHCEWASLTRPPRGLGQPQEKVVAGRTLNQHSSSPGNLGE